MWEVLKTLTQIAKAIIPASWKPKPGPDVQRPKPPVATKTAE